MSLLTVAATQAILDDINEMLRLCGDLPIVNLQTGTNSIAGRAETIYHAARRRVLGQKWHANVQTLDIEKDGSDHYVAPEGTMVIRPTSLYYNTTLRDGNLYDLTNDTAEFTDGPDTLECEVVFDYYPDRMPPMLRRAVLTQAAHDYLLGQKQAGGSVMDQRLFTQAEKAHAEALRENSDALRLNGRETAHAWRIRGQRPLRTDGNPDGRY